MKTFVIYHYPCLDGLVAAWSFWHTHPNDTDVEYLPTSHADIAPFKDIEKFRDGEIFLLDYCPPRESLIKLVEVANKVILLDHHKTTIERIKDVNGISEVVLDMDRSGAGISWDYFTQGLIRPPLVNYIEDNDLYTNKLSGHKEFTAWFDFIKPITFEDVAAANITLMPFADFTQSGTSYRIGKTILGYRDRMIENCFKYVYDTEIDGHKFKAINSSLVELNSDIGNAMVDKWKMPALVWYEHVKDGKHVISNSLRSRDYLIDVSQVASKFGGGGHRNAAGYTKVIS